MTTSASAQQASSNAARRLGAEIGNLYFAIATVTDERDKLKAELAKLKKECKPVKEKGNAK